MDTQRLQRKIKELGKEWNNLGDILVELAKEKALETKIEERIRLEHKIDKLKAERQQIEEQLDKLEAKLDKVSSIPTETEEKQETVEKSKVAHEKQQETPEQAHTKQPSEGMPELPMIRLRSEPRRVSKGVAQEVFRAYKKGWWVSSTWKPMKYIKNHFEDLGETVIDYATGLMWQKSGSDRYLYYKDAPTYIELLNSRRFSGYDDWRLPTVEELMSLLEPKKQFNGLYINPIFDSIQRWCWSADLCGSSSVAWFVYFDLGNVGWSYLDYENYVRAVRS